MASLLLADSFITALVEAGVVPERCTEVIIHAEVGSATILHYRVFGDADLLDVIPAAALKAKIRGAAVKVGP